MSENNYFSDEYTPDSTTEDTYTGKSGTKTIAESEDEFNIEEEKYGNSKPERIIIKTKLIDG